jgi:hypothetical protein
MKEIKTNRFAKEEEIEFEAHPITNQKSSDKPETTPGEPKAASPKSVSSNAYQITVP